jgi:DeoR family transcriptional regulator of aga operon
MLNEERRREILQLLERDGRVIVKDLSTRFHTSQITIRKDLEILHGRGVLQRTHGGALRPSSGALNDLSVLEKDKMHRIEKVRIAQAAVRIVSEGQSVLLDSGTTTLAIARALRSFRNLTVITNAVNIAAELASSEIEVILTGGTVRRNSFSLVGPLAEDSLRQLSADVLFLGVDGFDTRLGVSTPNIQEAKVNRVMVGISRTVVAVCDSSKFGRRSLSTIVPPNSIHHVITDKKIAKSDQENLTELGIQVTLV